MLRFTYNIFLRLFLTDIDFFNDYIFSPSLLVFNLFLSFLSPQTWLHPLFSMLGVLFPSILSQDSFKAADIFVTTTLESLLYNEKDLSDLNLRKKLLELLSSDTLMELNKFSSSVWISNPNFFTLLNKQLILSQEEHCFKMFLLENYPGKYFDLYPNCPVIEQVIQEFFAREFSEYRFEVNRVRVIPIVTKNTFFVNRDIYNQAFEDQILNLLEDLIYEDFYFKYIKGHEVVITFIIIQFIRIIFY